MKYIIEFEDEPYMREDGVNFYTCKSARWYKLGETIINRLTPYTEPDRKAIEDEVWEFASRLMTMHPDVAEGIYWSMNGGKGIGVAAEMTYHEAKAEYDAWLEKKKIHVGDEVEQITNSRNDTSKKCIVTLIEGNDRMNGITESGMLVVCSSQVNRWWKKTGRHFPEVAELLQKMRGE